MDTNTISFAEWLEGELSRRGWRPNDLSKAAGLYPGTIGRILNETRQAGPDVCRAIADALQLPAELVFRKAGLLPPKPADPPGLDEWIHAYVSAEQAEREDLLEFVRFKKSQRERKKNFTQ